MRAAGWIALGAIGVGLAVLQRMGKKVMEPSTSAVSPFPLQAEDEAFVGASPATVAKAEVASEMATQANAQLMQLNADRAAAEQRIYQLENALNAALAQKTPTSNADAATIEAERQALMARISQLETQVAAATATAAAAEQSLGQAQQTAVQEANRKVDEYKAAIQFDLNKQQQQANKNIQDVAAKLLSGGTGTGTGTSADEALFAKFKELSEYLKNYLSDQMKRAGSNKDKQGYINSFWEKKKEFDTKYSGANGTQPFATYFSTHYMGVLTDAQIWEATISRELAAENKASNESKWREAAEWVVKSWKEQYPKLTTDAARLEWFKAFDKQLQTTSEQLPGYNGWLQQNYASLITALGNEKRKVTAAVANTVTVDQKMTVWTDTANSIMQTWRRVYPALKTDVLKGQTLAEIYNTAQATQSKYPGFMAWFEQQYPGVGAQMIAEQNRIKGGTPPSTTPAHTNYSSPAATTPAVDPKVTDGYAWLLTAWRNYAKLPDDTKKKQAMTAFLAARTTPDGRKIWDYARTKNAALTQAIDAEAARLALAPAHANYSSPTAVKGLDEYVLKAQQYRDAAKILRADNMYRANVNMRLTRMMGR